MNRDRILTEKIIRGCWHEWPEKPSSPWQFGSDLCKKCGGLRGSVYYIDFSTWKGFGELWEQLRKRKYWQEFWKWLTRKYSWEEWELKNPSQRADVVFKFLQEKGEMSDNVQGWWASQGKGNEMEGNLMNPRKSLLLQEHFGKALTPMELAQYLGLNYRTILNFHKELGGQRIGKRIVFFERRVIDALEAQRRRVAGAASSGVAEGSGKIPRPKSSPRMGVRSEKKTLRAKDDRHAIFSKKKGGWTGRGER